ncbi:hypothetical protein F5880DRAFT_1615282 [Lentinula raphanica]|nr:hypothetical protein F5880DRAFT_1615282 [Lentinula raphanica]
MGPSLPTEILLLIVELLSDSLSDLRSCSLISSAWHAAAAKILFSDLHLLCSVHHPNLSGPHTKPKRGFDMIFGMIPVYRQVPSVQSIEVDCTCGDLQHRTVQSFLSTGASSLVHITQNVTRLNLSFCGMHDDRMGSPSNGPHSLQLYPDSVISSILQSIDKLSFSHLRRLTIDSAPQVLYFMTCEPFGGVLESACSSLEELYFTHFESMQNCDIKRLLSKHAFSCSRFPLLRHLFFQGSFSVSGTYGPRMNCVLEFSRSKPDAVSVGVSYSSFQDPLTKPDGLLKFGLPGWCCLSGYCFNSLGGKQLVDVLSLGTGVTDRSLPTIGVILETFQSNTLGQFARSLDVKVSSDINDPMKLFPYILQTYPEISSLNLSFSSISDMRLALLDNSKQGLDSFHTRTATITQHLLLFNRLSTLKFTLYDNAGFMLAFALGYSQKENPSHLLASDHKSYLSSLPYMKHFQAQFDIISALDVIVAELARLSIERQRASIASPSLHPVSLLREVVIEVDAGGDTSKSNDNRSLDCGFLERELETMFTKTRAANSSILTVRVL